MWRRYALREDPLRAVSSEMLLWAAYLHLTSVPLTLFVIGLLVGQELGRLVSLTDLWSALSRAGLGPFILVAFLAQALLAGICLLARIYPRSRGAPPSAGAIASAIVAVPIAIYSIAGLLGLAAALLAGTGGFLGVIAWMGERKRPGLGLPGPVLRPRRFRFDVKPVLTLASGSVCCFLSGFLGIFLALNFRYSDPVLSTFCLGLTFIVGGVGGLFAAYGYSREATPSVAPIVASVGGLLAIGQSVFVPWGLLSFAGGTLLLIAVARVETLLD